MNKTKFEAYQTLSDQPATDNVAWNMYGKGVENIGRNGRFEEVPLPKPNDDQMLVRVDSVGMCFSDVKLIRLGGEHPKLYNRDLAIEPTRLGHETAVTIIEVGQNLAEQYQVGQRLAIQPDAYQNGLSTAYGYTVPGGLIQYHLIGNELLETDAGACVLPLEGNLGYAETALLEPWGCVLAAYTQRRRLEPKQDGILWIVGQADDSRVYKMSRFLDRAKTIILTDVNDSIQQLVAKTGADLVVRNGVSTEEYATLNQELADGKGFDDIIMLNPQNAAQIHTLSKQIARRGTLNLVGTQPLDGLVDADVGRLHYDYIAFVGTTSDDMAESYGEARNRCDLHPNGVAVIVGAGGPMGQMHVQRAIELPQGPRLIIATELNQKRLDTLQTRFAPLAAENDCHLITFNPTNTDISLEELVMEQTNNQGADDVVICVPVASLMDEGNRLMNSDGMLVLFAGVPNGTMSPLNLSDVYLHNAQLTGTSGLTIDDQSAVMHRAMEGTLSPGRAVAAIGGMNAAQEGIVAMMESKYPGKIVIFPQIAEFPLVGLDELNEQFPQIGQHLGPNDLWTDAAEEALFNEFHGNGEPAA
ncbi:MAG: alcohol dehydrogenase catalytic domain-containing protein [Chloroflexota bacterium]